MICVGISGGHIRIRQNLVNPDFTGYPEYPDSSTQFCCSMTYFYISIIFKFYKIIFEHS